MSHTIDLHFPVFNGEDFENTMDVYVIATKEQQPRVQEQLKEMGLLDYSEIVDHVSADKIEAYERHPDCKLSSTDLARSVSHSRAYRNYLDTSPNKFALFLEGDFVTSSNIKDKSKMPQLLMAMIKDQGNSKWDILNLGRCSDCCSTDCQNALSNVHGFTTVQSKSASCGVGYLVTRRGAKALRLGSYPVDTKADANMIRVGKWGTAEYLAVTPKVFEQESSSKGECASEGSCNKHCDSGVHSFSVDVTSNPRFYPTKLPQGKEFTEDQRKSFFGHMDFLTSPQCNLGRKMKLQVVEWGFGATINSIIKPIMHALRFGYCIENPSGYVKYPCPNGVWNDVFLPTSADNKESSAAPDLHSFYGGKSGAGKNYNATFDEVCGKAFNNQSLKNWENKIWNECGQSYSFMRHGDNVLPQQGKNLGFFPTVSLIIEYLTRPNPSFAKSLEKAKKEANWPADGVPVIALHYRAGDSCLEYVDALGRKCDKFSVYMAHVNLMAQKYNISHVYLATDSDSVIKEELKNYPNYTWHYIQDMDRGGVRNNMTVDDLLLKHKLDGCGEAQQSMIDIHLLAQADAYVGKFSSNIDRVAYNLMYARKQTHQPYTSLDNNWCFDFGVRSRLDTLTSEEDFVYC